MIFAITYLAEKKRYDLMIILVIGLKTLYASCRQKEYENSLFKKGWDLEDAKAEAKSAFKINNEISDLIGTSERKIPDSFLNKITDPDLKKFVQNHLRSEIPKGMALKR